MAERKEYMPGVPCWVDTTQPDPEAAAEFYGGLFGWELEQLMPPESGAKYFMARIGGGDAAAISYSRPEHRRRRCGTPTSPSPAPTTRP